MNEKAADCRAGAESQRLCGRLQTDGPTAPMSSGGTDDDGDAIGLQQRSADRLKYPAADQKRQFGSHAAQSRSKNEQQEAHSIKSLATVKIGKGAEHR